LHNHRWYDCFRSSSSWLEAVGGDLEAYTPDIIVAYVSAISSLASYLDEQGRECKSVRRAIVVGAEKLHSHQRSLIEKVFGVPVYERYGSRDVGQIAVQLNNSDNELTVDWPNIMVQSDTDDRVGSILVTKLHADGFPMLRYRIGDLGHFPAARKVVDPVFRILEVVGRRVDAVLLRNGARVSGLLFPHLMKDYPIREFTIHQAADLSVAITIVPNDRYTEGSEQDLLKTLGATLPTLPLTLTKTSAIKKSPSNKWRPVSSDAIKASESTNVKSMAIT
jgi:phenylacetate-CoA ligase